MTTLIVISNDNSIIISPEEKKFSRSTGGRRQKGSLGRKKGSSREDSCPPSHHFTAEDLSTFEAGTDIGIEYPNNQFGGQAARRERTRTDSTSASSIDRASPCVFRETRGRTGRREGADADLKRMEDGTVLSETDSEENIVSSTSAASTLSSRTSGVSSGDATSTDSRESIHNNSQLERPHQHGNSIMSNKNSHLGYSNTLGSSRSKHFSPGRGGDVIMIVKPVRRSRTSAPISKTRSTKQEHEPGSDGPPSLLPSAGKLFRPVVLTPPSTNAASTSRPVARTHSFHSLIGMTSAAGQLREGMAGIKSADDSLVARSALFRPSENSAFRVLSRERCTPTTHKRSRTLDLVINSEHDNNNNRDNGNLNRDVDNREGSMASSDGKQSANPSLPMFTSTPLRSRSDFNGNRTWSGADSDVRLRSKQSDKAAERLSANTPSTGRRRSGGGRQKTAPKRWTDPSGRRSESQSGVADRNTVTNAKTQPRYYDSIQLPSRYSMYPKDDWDSRGESFNSSPDDESSTAWLMSDRDLPRDWVKQGHRGHSLGSTPGYRHELTDRRSRYPESDTVSATSSLVSSSDMSVESSSVSPEIRTAARNERSRRHQRSPRNSRSPINSRYNKIYTDSGLPTGETITNPFSGLPAVEPISNPYTSVYNHNRRKLPAIGGVFPSGCHKHPTAAQQYQPPVDISTTTSATTELWRHQQHQQGAEEEKEEAVTAATSTSTLEVRSIPVTEYEVREMLIPHTDPSLAFNERNVDSDPETANDDLLPAVNEHERVNAAGEAGDMKSYYCYRRPGQAEVGVQTDSPPADKCNSVVTADTLQPPATDDKVAPIINGGDAATGGQRARSISKGIARAASGLVKSTAAVGGGRKPAAAKLAELLGPKQILRRHTTYIKARAGTSVDLKNSSSNHIHSWNKKDTVHPDYKSSSLKRHLMRKASSSSRLSLLFKKDDEHLVDNVLRDSSSLDRLSLRSDEDGSGAGGLALTHGGRVAGWSRDFNNLLSDNLGLAKFTEFLRKEFSHENIYFWSACERFRYVESGEARRAAAKNILDRHLEPGAPEPVNIDSVVRQRLEEAALAAGVCTGGSDSSLKSLSTILPPPKDMFLSAQRQIYNLMKFDSYPRFLKSSVYTECVRHEVTIGHSLSSTMPKSHYHDGHVGLEDTIRGGRSVGNSSSHPSRSSSASSTSTPLSASNGTLRTQKVTARRVVTIPDSECNLTRVIFPDAATSVVPISPGESIRALISRLLEKRGLKLTGFEVFATAPSSQLPLDLSEDCDTLACTEVVVEPRVSFRLLLPNAQPAERDVFRHQGRRSQQQSQTPSGNQSGCLTVRAKPGSSLAEAVVSVLRQHGWSLTEVELRLEWDRQARGRLGHHHPGVDEDNQAEDRIGERLELSTPVDRLDKLTVIAECRPTMPSDETVGHNSSHEATLSLYEGLQIMRRGRFEDQRGTEISCQLPDFLKLASPNVRKTAQHEKTEMEATGQLDGVCEPNLGERSGIEDEENDVEAELRDLDLSDARERRGSSLSLSYV